LVYAPPIKVSMNAPLLLLHVIRQDHLIEHAHCQSLLGFVKVLGVFSHNPLDLGSLGSVAVNTQQRSSRLESMGA
jgi:hypothetical protein